MSPFEELKSNVDDLKKLIAHRDKLKAQVKTIAKAVTDGRNKVSAVVEKLINNWDMDPGKVYVLPCGTGVMAVAKKSTVAGKEVVEYSVTLHAVQVINV